MSTDILLRRATPEDLDGIMAIETVAFVNDAWSPATMRDELASEHTHYLAADDDGEIVGYAGLRAVRGSADADIQTIAVGASQRRRGLGRALLGALLVEAGRRGVHEVFLDVRVDNPGAQRMYSSFGFERIGVRPHYYMPDDVDALVMRLTLDPSTRLRLAQGAADQGASDAPKAALPTNDAPTGVVPADDAPNDPAESPWKASR
jgi:ribosomal-protein-alanine acetyltransferase